MSNSDQDGAPATKDSGQAYNDYLDKTAETYQRGMDSYVDFLNRGGRPAPKPKPEKPPSAGGSGAGNVSTYSVDRAAGYVSSMGSTVYNIMTKGFTGWFKTDPFAAISSFFNIASVFTKTNLTNLLKGSRNLLAGILIAGFTALAAILLAKKWWEPNQQAKQTAATTPLSPAQASQAQTELTQRVDRSSIELQRIGMDRRVASQSAAVTRITEGSRIASRARAYRGPVTARPDERGPLLVTGARRPDYYAPLANMNIDSYLHSLSNPRTTRRDIALNSTAVHEETLRENKN